MLEDGTEIIYDIKKKKTLEQPDYVIDIIHRSGKAWNLARRLCSTARIYRCTNRSSTIRTALSPLRRPIRPTTTTTDSASLTWSRSNRPKEEYSIRLTVEKLVINEQLRDDQFALQQPIGSQLVNLDQPQPMAASNSTASPQPGDNPKK